MKKTFRDLFMFVGATAQNVYNEETKGQKKLKLIRDKVQSYLDDYQEQADGLRLDAASVDDKGNLILDEKGEYKFTKEALKKLTLDIKELSKKEFNYTPITIINPSELDQYLFLEDWVIGVKFEKVTEELIEL